MRLFVGGIAATAKSLQSCPTLRSHRWHPTRLHRPWDSPGKKHWSGLPFLSPMQESEKWKWSRSVMLDSSGPHGPQPTRLLPPWDFPGKSTGVGCHCLLWPEVNHFFNHKIQMAAMGRDSIACLIHGGKKVPGSSIYGIFQARILEQVAIFSSRGSSRIRDQTHVSCIGRWILDHWVTVRLGRVQGDWTSLMLSCLFCLVSFTFRK